MVFHNFKRITEFEKLNDKFYIKQGDSYRQDEFLDEIVLGIVTEKGLVVVVGCSHVGIINILETITRKTDLPIYAVIGGTHLIEADQSRMEQTITSFRDMNIKRIAVSHCTGEEGVQSIKDNFPEQFIFNNTGNVINLGAYNIN